MTIVVVRRQKRITMEGSASSINSRATTIKTILLVAWRAKLSNEEWESRIRKVLPRGVSGDVYDLADCLLKQALVGPVPNQLFMSYLKHAVTCELVSHGSVLSSMAQQSTNIRTSSINYNNSSSSPTTSSRTSSVICLLEFLRSFRERISCKGTEIECLNLCLSLSQLIHWLLKCVQNSLESVISANSPQSSIISGSNIMATNLYNNSMLNNSAQYELTSKIIELCTETIHHFINRPFTKSLLFISKIEYSKEFDDILQTVQSIQQKLTSWPSSQFIQERVQQFNVLQQLNSTFNSAEMHPSVVAAQQLRCLQMHRIRSTHVTSGSNFERKIQQSLLIHDSTTNYALFNSLYSLVAFDVVLRPARSHKLLARQIATITNFNSAPVSITYCELIRICMIGLIDADGTPAKVKWAFFTFLKMPKLLIELSKVFKTPTVQDPTNLLDCITSNQITNFINDLKLAFERLCEYSPLLDEAEYKCNCDFLKCLVKELIKNDSGLIQLKTIDYKKFLAKRATLYNNDSSVGGHMMLRTEPVVTSMLETFDTEQDPVELYAILGQLVSGKQFEFTLSAAASTGRLQMFVKKLVEHNELNRIPRNDSPKNPRVQALIFDITFLILSYIAQQYGQEVIGTDQQSTFNKWFYDCYNPSTRINCPKEMLKNSNDGVVSNLIKQIVPSDGEIQMKSVNWLEVCQNMPKAINEILIAWNQGHLDDNDMKGIIERIKSRMCFVAVITATWLQCYIRTLNDSDKQKPLSLLQNLTKASQQAKQHKQATISETGLKSESYSERSSLMCSIIRKIYFEFVPKTTGSSTCQNPQSSISISGLVSNNSTSTVNSNNSCNTATTTSTDSDESLDESAYQSINDKFVSTLTTEEIFLANVKQCLSRGWIDHKSLYSLNSLFKIIGSECFTDLIVEQILTSHESPSDLSRAVNITFGLFHLDIEACAFALLKDTIPSWLMGEKKQVLLNQPRAFALANLTVMTIVEVFNNLKASLADTSNNGSGCNQQTTVDRKDRLAVNGIKQEPGLQQQQQKTTILMDIDQIGALNGPKDVKRIKLTHDVSKEKASSSVNNDIAARLSRLNGCVADLMILFKEIMSSPVMNQRTLFPILFLQQAVVCTRESSTVITAHLQPEILLDIINLFSSELTFELVIAISNLSTTNSRKYAAKAMCQLAQVKESKQNQLVSKQAQNFTNRLGLFNQASNSSSSSSTLMAK